MPVPISYSTLKCVLEHLDPNMRFHLLRTCPSLRIPEKIAPSKFKFLSFNTLNFTVNSTNYKIGRFRIGSPELLPTDSKRIDFQMIERLPGDLLIPGNKPIGAWKPSNRNFQEFTRLVVEDENTREIMRTETTEYGTSIWNAMRYLIYKFFSGRGFPIKVEALEIRPEKLIRLPMDLKIRIKELDYLSKNLGHLDDLKEILDPESFPLASFLTDGVFTDSGNFEHPLIKNSKIFVIKNFKDITVFSHKRVYFLGCEVDRAYLGILVNYWRIIHMDVGTCYSYAFGIGLLEQMANLMTQIFDIPGARIAINNAGDRRRMNEDVAQCVAHRVVIPIYDQTEVHIFCDVKHDSNHRFLSGNLNVEVLDALVN